MEIKILCACGTKFKFDVEPVPCWTGNLPISILADIECFTKLLQQLALLSGDPPDRTLPFQSSIPLTTPADWSLPERAAL